MVFNVFNVVIAVEDSTQSDSSSVFGIYDTFPDDAGRQAHLNGPIAAALMQKASDLLSKPPSIEKVDVLAAKLPSSKAERAA